MNVDGDSGAEMAILLRGFDGRTDAGDFAL